MGEIECFKKKIVFVRFLWAFRAQSLKFIECNNNITCLNQDMDGMNPN